MDWRILIELYNHFTEAQLSTVSGNTEEATTSGFILCWKLGMDTGHWNVSLGVNQIFVLVFGSSLSGH